MENLTISIPTRKSRRFFPNNFVINSWEKLETFFIDLKDREIHSLIDLENWLKDRSELDAVLEEDMAWRYIKMNIDTTDEILAESFNFFVNQISPKIAPFEDLFNKKLIQSPFLNQLNRVGYDIYFREIRKEIEIFRNENIPLNTIMQTEQQKYGALCALMMVEIDGIEMTLQKAANFLKDLDRNKREEAYRKIKIRRLQDVEKLNELFNKLIEIRHKVAINADFTNYRDFMFVAKGRFDYSVDDCRRFHKSIAMEIVPVIKDIELKRKQTLGLDKLMPWDTEIDVSGKPPLKPFETGKDLLDKTIECFSRLRPSFGRYIEIMKEMGHLDLESKKGKAPGGFNYPLYEIGVPFIYMNAVGSLRDLVTMVHEGGHAIHSFLTRDLELTSFKNCPSEVAELASMGMELISMTHWDIFFKDKDELRRAKREQLEKVLHTLPWVATIDKYQHWIYENPQHSVAQRQEAWLEILNEFSAGVVNWEGNEDGRAYNWQKQLHLYEVPFYYIEYGFAQLGAIALWRNYINNPEKALNQYEEALSLGYTKSIGEIYKTAGISFNFSPEYVKELADFVKLELAKL